MNTFLKGGIAAAAGLTVLLGGGTLAVWNDAVSVDAGTVASGTLAIDSNADGAWSEDIDFIVPGDSTTYTETFVIEAVGDNLQAELEADLSGVLNGVTGSTVTTTFVVTDENDDVLTPVLGVYTFGEGDYEVSVEIEVDFPEAATAGQNATINLGAIEITLTQVV